MPAGYIPNAPVYVQDNIIGKLPSIWYGEVALSGTVSPWKDVAIGSVYIDNSSGTAVMYVKKVNVPATADWGTVTLT